MRTKFVNCNITSILYIKIDIKERREKEPEMQEADRLMHFLHSRLRQNDSSLRIINPINIQSEVSDDHRINCINDTSLHGPR